MVNKYLEKLAGVSTIEYAGYGGAALASAGGIAGEKIFTRKAKDLLTRHRKMETRGYRRVYQAVDKGAVDRIDRHQARLKGMSDTISKATDSIAKKAKASSRVARYGSPGLAVAGLLGTAHREKKAALVDKEPGIQYDHSNRTYYVSKDRAIAISSPDDSKRESLAAKTFAGIGGALGVGIGAVKGGVKGALVGGSLSAAAGGILGRAIAKAGTKDAHQNTGFIKNKAQIYIGRNYRNGWNSKVVIQ